MMKKLAALHLLMILIGQHLLGGCSGLNKHDQIEVFTLSDPVELSQELGTETIIFGRKERNGTSISIMSLDLKINDLYQLDRNVIEIDISPNGKSFVYISGDYVKENYQLSLWLFDVENNLASKIAGWEKDISEIYISNPSYSPDGKRILFAVDWIKDGESGLATINLDGSNFNKIITGLPVHMEPRYSPDNLKILVGCVGLDEGSGVSRFQLCLLEKDGQKCKILTDQGDYHGEHYFTPDGDRIVFTEITIGGLLGLFRQEYSFYIMDINGNSKQLLLDWIVGVHRFSENGEEIIFQGKENEKSPWGIYIINIDGTNLRHLTYFDEFLEEWYADIEQY